MRDIRVRLGALERSIGTPADVAAVWVYLGDAGPGPEIERRKGNEGPVVYRMWAPEADLPRGLMVCYRMADGSSSFDGLESWAREAFDAALFAVLTPRQAEIVRAARCVVVVTGGSLHELGPLPPDEFDRYDMDRRAEYIDAGGTEAEWEALKVPIRAEQLGGIARAEPEKWRAAMDRLTAEAIAGLRRGRQP